MNPKVTTLMAVYNGESFLDESVSSILNQTFSDFELLVIDDGSTDGTAEILERYEDPRVRVIRNAKNLGLTKSLNIGLQTARAEFIARHDADDRSHPDRLARQVAFLDMHPEVVAVGTQARLLTENGRVRALRGWRKATSNLGIRWQLMFDSPFFHTAVMFRRSVVWNALGGYDERFPIRQDFELWSRLNAQFELRNLPDVLVDFRVSAASLSNRDDAEELRRVERVMFENRKRTLRSGSDVAEGLSEWLQVHTPGPRGAVADLRPLVRGDRELFARFSELYPEAVGDREIRRYRATNLARAAGSGARRRARGSFGVLAAAYRLEPRIGAYWAVRFCAHALSGMMRRGSS